MGRRHSPEASGRVKPNEREPTGMETGCTIVVPAYNEEESIGKVLDQLESMATSDPRSYQILVVDDGSEDGTAEVVRKHDVELLRHSSNVGYGAALKTGIRRAGHERIVIIDSDCTYPVDRIPDLLKRLESSDMTVGARTGSKVHDQWIRKPGKWIIRHLTQYVTGDRIPDFNSGLRAFRREFVMRYLSILPAGFSFTTTLTVAALCDGYLLDFVPIDYHPRRGKSKISASSFFTFVALVARLSVFFRPLRVFVPISLGCLGLGVTKLVLDLIFASSRYGGLSLADLFTRPVISISALLFVLSSLQIILVGMVAEALARTQNGEGGYSLRSDTKDKSDPRS
ncbi:glycosyltransferase [Candidatus Fermentibacteria bacterium]|nr:glycosyltransferase [Candidatus Fermentibacteria bacterium]